MLRRGAIYLAGAVLTTLVSGCSGGASADIHNTPEAKAQAKAAEDAAKANPVTPNEADQRRAGDAGATRGR